jgi:ubiquitin-protein ligase
MAQYHANIIRSNSLRRRLLQDIAEIKQDPYPNVNIEFDDNDITKACLILTPEGQKPLHLKINFPGRYPLIAPNITIQSRIIHPNVFNEYICATMLNTEEGWTPAYTLKGIVIQLLSFFCSDSLEQDHGNGTIDLTQYRQEATQMYGGRADNFACSLCGFGPSSPPALADEMEINFAPPSTVATLPQVQYPNRLSRLFTLPDEIVLAILTESKTCDVLAFADAVPSIKTMINSYDFIRIRQLQCFCLKRSFLNTKLGVGISIKDGNRPVFRSEFDLLSWEAYYTHGVRHSVQGVSFDKWLPLPLNRRHWNQVKTDAMACIQDIHTTANMASYEPYYVDVLYHTMNTVVVQFSSDAEKGYNGPDARSTLSHASEKAVDAYFGLFHLLLCLATEHKEIIASANNIIQRFIAGPRTKTHFPDLGHVLVAALICDAGLTEELTYEIIREAILRNVVWMLDYKGAGMAELAYLEPSAISRYRTNMTYAASPTSYRLMMFMKLFSSAARPPNKTLIELRNSFFDAHGAPPTGTSTRMAEDIREIHEFSTFPQFLAKMGLKQLPSQSQFTTFLRRTITDSINAGYSIMPLTQSQLYLMRQAKEPDVEVSEDVIVTYHDRRWFRDRSWQKPSFFPNRGGHGGRGGRGGRGSRGPRGSRGRR